MIKSILRKYSGLLLLCMSISLALYMTAAWKSAIYLHPDEYYQIVEFASFKMHITTADQMAWEYGEKIRPALQPLMCYTLLKGMNLVQLTDHYTQLYLLRVLSALFSLAALTLFCLTSLPFIIESYRKVYILSCFLFWYPYTYGVHFSSETWSGGVILIAVSLTAFFYQDHRRHQLLFFSSLGVILGAAFLLRFQTAFISAGIVCWMIVEKKEKLRHIFLLIVSGAIVLTAGVMMDRWLYGEWLCVPWRYFDSAFIHTHGDFGSKPFYFYPLFFILMLSPPIGLVVAISLFTFFFMHSKSLYTWALLPFLLFHGLVGHKEFRFMYPVMNFFPLVVVMAYQGWKEKKVIVIPRWVLTTGKVSIAVFNILCIVIFVFYSDRFLFDSKIFLGKIHELAKEKQVVVYCKDVNNSPYVLPKASIPKDLFPEYMRDASVKTEMISELKEVRRSDVDTSRLIATNQYEYMSSRLEQDIIMRTLTDLAFVRDIAGDDAYRGIEENTYYLTESK